MSSEEDGGAKSDPTKSSKTRATVMAEKQDKILKKLDKVAETIVESSRLDREENRKSLEVLLQSLISSINNNNQLLGEEIKKNQTQISQSLTKLDKNFEGLANSLGVLKAPQVSDFNRNSDQNVKSLDNKTVEQNVSQSTSLVNYMASFKEVGGFNLVFRSESNNVHPVEFINELCEMFEEAGVPDGKRVSYALKALKGEAATWGKIYKEKFYNFQKFKEEFLERYWSAEIQRKVNRNLIGGSYSGGSKREYFMKKVAEFSYLDTNMTEGDLVDTLSHHFPKEIERTIKIYNYTTVMEIEQYLKRLDDMEDGQSSEDSRHRDYQRTGNSRWNNNSNGNAGTRNNLNQSTADSRPRDNQDDWRSSRNQNARRNDGRRDASNTEVSELVVPFISDGTSLLSEDEEEKIVKEKLPVVNAVFEALPTSILIDTGSQVSCISQDFATQLRQAGYKFDVLPASGATIVGALSRRSQKVVEQVYLKCKIQDVEFLQVYLVVPSLIRNVILGCDWMADHKIHIDFSESLILGDFQGQRKQISCFGEWGRKEELNVSEITQASGLEGDEDKDTEEKILNPPQGSTGYSEEEISAVVEKAETFSRIEKQKLFQLLVKYRSIFSDRPGRVQGYEHQIELHNYEPFFLKSFPVPFVYRNQVKEQIREMEEWGVIRKASTEYVSPLVVVKKKDGMPRVCLDARHLNARMVQNHVIPPSPSDLLFDFKRGQKLSCIDLAASYWQIPIREEHQKYTGFSFDGHTYVFQVLPFGLSTSVGSFISCLSKVLGDECQEFVIPYVDDLLIHSTDSENHLRHLEIVFKKLKQRNLTIKLRKCCFGKKQVHFLGHWVSDDEIKMDETRIASIRKFPSPRNIKQLRSFLGLVNFDRRFVKDFASKTLKLQHLLKKGCKWTWSDQEERAFEEIKECFIKTLALKHPDMDKTFYINSDASAYAIGAVLYQKVDGIDERDVIAYYSRSLKGAEMNYTVTEKEALGIVEALKQWRVYVLGRKVVISTDHQALSFLKSCKLLNSRLTRWILYLQEYDLSVQYCPAAENKVSDTLSRYPPDRKDIGRNTMPKDNIIEVSFMKKTPVYKVVCKQFESIQEMQSSDKYCQGILEELKRSNGRTNIVNWFVCQDGLLFRKGTLGDPGYKICVPSKIVNSLVLNEHENNGHFGVAKCFAHLHKQHFWPKMKSDVKRIIRCCDLCQKAKIGPHSFGPMHSIIPNEPNEIVSVDLMGPLPTGRGGATQLLVIVDVFSKFVSLYALKRATACNIVKKVRLYVSEVGKPKRILSDNGPQFTSKLYLEAMQELGIIVGHTSSYFPQGNPVERANREIGRLLRSFCHAQHTRWPNVLPDVQEWINHAVHDSTGFTPMEIHFGKSREEKHLKNINFPLASFLPPDIVVLAHEKLLSKSEKRKARLEDFSRFTTFKIGDQVLVKSHKLSSLENREIQKFFLLYKGPCTVEAVVYGNCYIIRENATGIDLGKQNVYNLKPYHSPVSFNE